MDHKDMLTNPEFCPMPWTGLMYNADGTVKNCIRSNKILGRIQDQPIEQILLGAENHSRQASIVARQPVASCSPCRDLEQGQQGFNHVISDRIFYLRELKQVPPETYRAGNFDLQAIDVRWSNLCNFACVYCDPSFSSRWASELGITVDQPTVRQRTDFKNWILDRAPGLKHVYLAGGEPLLIKENLELLDRLDPDVNIRVNTNLSNTDTQVFERICKFKNVHWTVSMESLGQQFEYIRWGSTWQDFETNLAHIQSLDHRITFNMLWFLLNHDSVFDAVAWCQGQGFHNNSFVIGALTGPAYLNVRNLPNNVLQYLQHRLETEINQQPGYLLEQSYRNMLHHLQQPFQANLHTAFERLADLDQRRGIDSSEIFKDLYKLREET